MELTKKNWDRRGVEASTGATAETLLSERTKRYKRARPCGSRVVPMSGSAGESKAQAAGAKDSGLGGGVAGIPSGEPGGWLTMKRSGSGPEWFRQMQLDMLCKENANLASKLVPPPSLPCNSTRAPCSRQTTPLCRIR